MKRVYLLLPILLFMILISSQAFGIQGFTVGLALQGCTDQYTFNNTAYELYNGYYGAHTATFSHAVLWDDLGSQFGADIENFDDGAGVFENGGDVIGMGFSVDIRYRWKFLMIRLGITSEWATIGGVYSITYNTQDYVFDNALFAAFTGMDSLDSTGSNFRIELSASGMWLIVPLDICAYIPLFDDKAGFFAGLGPAFCYSNISLALDASSFAAQVLSMSYYSIEDPDLNQPTHGELNPSTAGIGFEIIMGYEHEIMENLSIFAGATIDIFAQWTEDIIDGSADADHPENFVGQNKISYYMISNFDEMSDDVRSYVDDSGDTHFIFPLSSVTWRFNIGVQYKIF